MESLVHLDTVEMVRLIAERELSPVELTQAHIDRIEELNDSLNAIVVLASDALEMAHEAERTLISGEDLGPLHGVPYTVKDSIDVAGYATSSGSLLTPSTVAVHDAQLRGPYWICVYLSGCCGLLCG